MDHLLTFGHHACSRTTQGRVLLALLSILLCAAHSPADIVIGSLITPPPPGNGVVITGGSGIPDAPADTNIYGRSNATWVVITPGTGPQGPAGTNGTDATVVYGTSSTNAYRGDWGDGASNKAATAYGWGNHATNGYVTNGATVTLYSTNTGPAGMELVNADWVRGRFANGIYLYASTNVTTSGYDTNSFVYATTLPAPFTRTYNSVTANQYIGASFSPTLLTNASGPAVVSTYLGISAGAVTLKPELYFTVDKTNTLYEAADVTPQSVGVGTPTAPLQWTFAFPDQTTPCYVMRRFKVVSKTGSPNVTLYGGTNTPSILSIEAHSAGGAETDPNWAAQSNAVATGINARAYIAHNQGLETITNFNDSSVVPTILTSATTVTITRANGNLLQLSHGTNITIELPSALPTNGIGEITLLLNAGVFSTTWSNLNSYVSFATAPTILTNGWSLPIMCFRNIGVTNNVWTGRQ